MRDELSQVGFPELKYLSSANGTALGARLSS